MIRKLIQWLATPIVAAALRRAEANVRAESERAELWRKRCVSVEQREQTVVDNYQRRIAELEQQLQGQG